MQVDVVHGAIFSVKVCAFVFVFCCVSLSLSLRVSLSLSLSLSPSVSLSPSLTRSETRSLCLDPPAATPLHLESSPACNCLPATTLRCCVLPVSVWVCRGPCWFTTRSVCFGLACKSTFLPRSCVCPQLRCYYSGLPMEYARPFSNWRISLERLDNSLGYTILSSVA